MNVSMFRHDRNASPTVRECNAAAQVEITDRTQVRPGSASPGARQLPQQLAGLPRIMHHDNRVIEYTAPGESFTTFTWPAHHQDAAPLEHAHTRLDVRNLHDVEMQAYLTKTIHDDWGARPILHAFEQASLAVTHDLDGKNRHDRAMQTFRNCKDEAQALQTRYAAFAGDAACLLANRADDGLDGATGATATASAPLLRIAQSIWPTLRFNSAEEKTAWVERTLRNPQPFIAQSYDALSLALGRVGVGITQAKSEVYETGRDKSAEERNSIMQSMQATDTAFLAAEAGFERIDIPIEPSILKGHSVLAAYSRPTL